MSFGVPSEECCYYLLLLVQCSVTQRVWAIGGNPKSLEVYSTIIKIFSVTLWILGQFPTAAFNRSDDVRSRGDYCPNFNSRLFPTSVWCIKKVSKIIRDVLSKSMFGVGSRPTQISEKRYVQGNVEKINVVWINNLMFWFPEGF